MAGPVTQAESTGVSAYSLARSLGGQLEVTVARQNNAIYLSLTFTPDGPGERPVQLIGKGRDMAGAIKGLAASAPALIQALLHLVVAEVHELQK